MTTRHHPHHITFPTSTVDVYWSSSCIAVFLAVGDRQVRDEIVKLPDFPPALALEKKDGVVGHPRWSARAVIEWAKENYRPAAQESIPKRSRGGRPRKHSLTEQA